MLDGDIFGYSIIHEVDTLIGAVDDTNDYHKYQQIQRRNYYKRQIPSSTMTTTSAVTCLCHLGKPTPSGHPTTDWNIKNTTHATSSTFPPTKTVNDIQMGDILFADVDYLNTIDFGHDTSLNVPLPSPQPPPPPWPPLSPQRRAFRFGSSVAATQPGEMEINNKCLPPPQPPPPPWPPLSSQHRVFHLSPQRARGAWILARNAPQNRRLSKPSSVTHPSTLTFHQLLRRQLLLRGHFHPALRTPTKSVASILIPPSLKRDRGGWPVTTDLMQKSRLPLLYSTPN